MSTNGSGGLIPRETEFAMYDRLPPEVRKLLQDAPISLGSGSAMRMLMRRSPREAVSELALRLREYMLGLDAGSTLMAWTWSGGKFLKASRGSDHPQAQEECKWAYQLKPRRTLRTVHSVVGAARLRVMRRGVGKGAVAATTRRTG